MTSIIPSPGGRPASQPLTTQIVMTGDNAVIAAGTVIYAADVPMSAGYTSWPWGTPAVWLEYINDPQVNNGTVWAVSSILSDMTAVYVYQVNGDFTNNGKIVCEVTAEVPYVTSNAYGLLLNNGLNNTGEIFALSNGRAYAFYTQGRSVWTNSGLMAAQGETFACGAYLYNGGWFTNTSAGSILAEGNGATGVYIGRGTFSSDDDTPQLSNAGLIQAVSTGSAPSIGVAIGNTELEPVFIVNSGTIQADIAFYNPAAYANVTSTQRSAVTITNQASGLIEGDFYLDLGDDTLTNAGTIHGDIDMGEGDDTLDTSAGALTGVVDMGFGDDSFVGSASGDVALGNRNDDTMDGGGGADLLLGGRGDDVLIGGAGKDGLYGEFGADRIVTQGGDVVSAGAGNDRIELGDLTFARVDGGAGIDTLVMPTGTAIFDFQAMRNSGRVMGIEQIALQGSQKLVLRAADVIAMTQAGSPAMVRGGASDSVYLVGGWTKGADQIVDDQTYTAYSLNTTLVLIDADSAVTIGDAPPAGAVGLSAVAAGAAAPLPGSIPGADYTGSITDIVGYEMTSPLTIDSDEVWRSLNGGTTIFTEAPAWHSPLVNYGEVSSWSSGSIGATAIQAYTVAKFDNYGLVGAYVDGDGDATGYIAGAFGKVNNQGVIEAYTVGGTALAVMNFETGESYGDPAVLNDGEIIAYSENDYAVGLFSFNIFTYVTNNGLISAYGGLGAVAVHLDNSQLFQNTGTVVAGTSPGGNPSIGIYIYSNDYSEVINTGLISGDIAIYTEQEVYGHNTVVVNQGQIEGWIILGRTYDKVQNDGSIDGEIYFGWGKDVYEGEGSITGAVHGDEGDDTLIGSAGAEEFWGGADNDTLNGGGGDDQLAGEAGADSIAGGDGADWIIGGGDADDLNGGAGGDTFLYELAGDSTAGAMDRIRGFQSGVDKIDLTALGPVVISWTEQTDPSDSSLYSLVTVVAGDQTMTLRVDGHVAKADFLVDMRVYGTQGADQINGTAADDIIYALGGADTLDGKAGADKLYGGGGDDTYILDASDTVIEDPASGVDTVRTSTTYTLTAEVENLVLTGSGAINGWGNALANRLTGNGATNQLNGGAGDDLLDGGAGVDVLTGGLGNDTFVVDADKDKVIESAGEGTDLVQASVSFTLLDHVENLTLVGGAAINATGNASANVLTGNGANNALKGGDGADTLIGGGGFDTASYAGAAASVMVSLAAGVASGGAGADTLSSIEGLIGSPFADSLSGDGLANLLDGGAGADTLAGAGGDDSYLVDNAGDVVSELAGGGTDVINSTINYSLGDNVENLTLIGSAKTATGNALANALTGNAQNNTLTGGLGADLLIGGAGADTADYREKTAAVVVMLGSGDATVFVNGVAEDTVREVENVLGGTAADKLTGNDAANYFAGGKGDDVLAGRGGADSLDGGAGRDTADYSEKTGAVVVTLLDAGAASVTVGGLVEDSLQNVENLVGGTGADKLTGNGLDNTLAGGAGADALTGGLGNDRLEGGAGVDVMVGGAGNDVYVVDAVGEKTTELAGEGSDRVEASITWTISGGIEQLTLTGSAAINGSGNNADNTLIGNDAANTLSGGAGADHIEGGGGADILNGGQDADVMIGGLGNDYYVVNSARDRVVEAAGEGIDTIETTVGLRLGATIENLVIGGTRDTNGTGNAFANTLTGNDAVNTLLGLDGDDTINGAGGADVIGGGLGLDVMTGGLGADRFLFDDGDTSASTSTSDRILDFNELEDVIGLADIDAVQGIAGDQAFTFIGSHAFNGVAGELRVNVAGSLTIVSGDTNGDGVADFIIRLTGAHTLGVEDFFL